MCSGFAFCPQSPNFPLMSRTLIMDANAVDAKLRRMAFEIYEQHHQDTDIILLGVAKRGGFLAKKLHALLKDISDLEVELAFASLDVEVRQGRGGLMQTTFSLPEASLQGKTVLVVDDVLYSGNTLLNVISTLHACQPTIIKTVVLIDRGHRSMPIFSHIVGLELATSLQQHVEVDVNEKTMLVEAFLV